MTCDSARRATGIPAGLTCCEALANPDGPLVVRSYPNDPPELVAQREALIAEALEQGRPVVNGGGIFGIM